MTTTGLPACRKLCPNFLSISDAPISTYVIPDALPLCHPGRDSEPGSSCSGECFTPGRYSKCGGLLDTGSRAGMTTKTKGPQPSSSRTRRSPPSSSRPHLLPPSSRTRQRAGIQLRQVMLYPRQIFKVRWFTGYRLGGRYDEIKPMSRNLRYLGRAYLPPTPSRTHFPLVIPDATASRDPVTPWHEAVYAKPKHGSAFAVILTR
ncbi:hypothetical protein IMCC21906_00119 [Spongiibacter sp. IMCC21906]|nr:hypothetical protein IMCC21906_00119 [Spongiibacter sp. IMCC21906]